MADTERHVEKPVTRVDCEAVVAAVKGAIAAGQREVEIPWGGTALIMTTAEDGTHSLGGPQAPAMDLHVEPESRPADYPDGLPFLPEAFVATEVSPYKVVAMWWAPPEPDARRRELHQQSLAAGWVPEGDGEAAGRGMVRQRYLKDSRSRDIFQSEGFLTLIEHEWRSEGEGDGEVST